MPSVATSFVLTTIALIFSRWDLITRRVLAAKAFTSGFCAVFEASSKAGGVLLVILYHLSNVGIVELGTGELAELIHSRFVVGIQVRREGDPFFAATAFNSSPAAPWAVAIITPKSLIFCRVAFSFATSPSWTSSIPP